jgi:hypothetical protein
MGPAILFGLYELWFQVDGSGGTHKRQSRKLILKLPLAATWVDQSRHDAWLMGHQWISNELICF